MLCPICQKKDSLPQLVDERRHVYVCKACTHQFTVQPPEEQEDYDKEYFALTHKNWFENPDFRFFQRILERFSGVLGERGKLLDIGCGNGDLLLYLHGKKPNWDLTGIDLIENTHPRIHFVQGDIYTTPFQHAFDGVVCLHTIEHVTDPTALAGIFASTVSPTGLLLVATIDSSSLIHKIAWVLKCVGIRVAYDRIFSSHHVHHFTFSSLEKLLEQNGFTVLEHYNYNHPLKAVDVPAKGMIGTIVYKSIVWVIFSVLRLQGKGMLQAIICKKNVQQASL